MAATTKLSVYNQALREIGAAPLLNTTTANTSLHTLDGAWDHAVERVLAMRDWGFARRRSALTGSTDSSFPPYSYRYAKPSDYLRKCWVKTAAKDDYQADHAEVAAVIYGFLPTVLIEYISDHADNYDPVNWPPHFTRAMALFLASLVAPKLARAGADDLARLNAQMGEALADADAQESVFLTNEAIAAERHAVMRRTLEFLGQQLAGSVSMHAHTDMLRWHMNRSWDHAVKYVLEMGAWNFATRRLVLDGGTAEMPGRTDTDLIEGYTLGPASDPDATDQDELTWDDGTLIGWD